MRKFLEKEIADKLSHAIGKKRSEVVKYYMQTYSISQGMVYDLAHKGGYRSYKNRRKDAGILRGNVNDADITLIAGMQKATKRKNRKMLLPTNVALDLLNDAREKEGRDAVNVSVSTVNRYMRERGKSRKQMLDNWTTDDHQTPAFCISLKAEFVNEWHVFDITPCIQYYFKPKKGLAQHDQNLELYPGKLENFKKIGAHLHRYVLIDVKSHAYFFKYYYSKGENLADLLDFLYSAWSFKEQYQFCGVPYNLYADKGAANKSGFLRSVTDALGINLHHHKAGNSRAKGIVEERMKYIQETFECKTAFRPAMSVEEINQWGFEFCIKDNATKKHTRLQTTRLAFWTTHILPEHKRELKCTREIFLGLAVSGLKEATVGAYMSIQFNGEEYYIRGPVNRGEKILVDYDYLDQNKIRTWKKDVAGEKGILLENKMVTWNKHRERDNAVQIGKEYKRLPDTPVQTAMKEMDGLDYSKVAEVAFGHDLEKIPEKLGFIERQGTEIEIAEKTEVGKAGSWEVERLTSQPPNLPTSEVIAYPRGEVFKEIRFRARLERIAPIQAQWIEKLLGDRLTVEDAVIEEIITTVFHHKDTKVAKEELKSEIVNPKSEMEKAVATA